LLIEPVVESLYKSKKSLAPDFSYALKGKSLAIAEKKGLWAHFRSPENR
jgi:hypothetical protein